MTDENKPRRLPLPDASGAALPDAHAVARFLEAHPDFLARRPELYLSLEPPERVHGDTLADHMAAQLRQARRQNERLAADIRTRRDDASFADRVEAALLGLLRAADPLDWAAHELAPTLGLDSAAIRLETDTGTVGSASSLPAGSARRLLGGRAIRFRREPDTLALLHGEAAPLVRRDVLLLLTPFGKLGVLALGNRDGTGEADGRARLPGPGAERALTTLRRAVEAALERQ